MRKACCSFGLNDVKTNVLLTVSLLHDTEGCVLALTSIEVDLVWAEMHVLYYGLSVNKLHMEAKQL
jgi:hypothetical protein